MPAGGESKAQAKGPEAFRTISEASSELGVPQHVLRFWETKFSFIRPMKRAGGRRFYRRQDIAVLRGVRTLLHDEGYTIKGVQRLHKEQGVRRLIGAGDGEEHLEAPTLEAAPASAEPPPPRPRRKASEPPAEPAPPVPPAPSPTAILKDRARDRLEAVLRDIESVKAGIDDLLGRSDD